MKDGQKETRQETILDLEYLSLMRLYGCEMCVTVLLMRAHLSGIRGSS